MVDRPAQNFSRACGLRRRREGLIEKAQGKQQVFAGTAVVNGGGKGLLAELVAVIADAAESTRTKLRTTGPLDVHTRLNERSSTTGLSLGEFATLLALPANSGGLGARDALNLDGGYSTSFAARIGDARIRIEPYRATINAVRVRAGI